MKKRFYKKDNTTRLKPIKHTFKPIKKMIKRTKGLMLIILLVTLTDICYAQNGYIYLHKKTLDESSSVDFTFNITVGPNYSTSHYA